jgi:hypothetical protein
LPSTATAIGLLPTVMVSTTVLVSDRCGSFDLEVVRCTLSL